MRTYEYDPYGNRTALREKNSITQYAYNEADQLITKTDPDGVTSYTYDNRGNLKRAFLTQCLAGKYRDNVYNMHQTMHCAIMSTET